MIKLTIKLSNMWIVSLSTRRLRLVPEKRAWRKKSGSICQPPAKTSQEHQSFVALQLIHHLSRAGAATMCACFLFHPKLMLLLFFSHCLAIGSSLLLVIKDFCVGWMSFFLKSDGKTFVFLNLFALFVFFVTSTGYCQSVNGFLVVHLLFVYLSHASELRGRSDGIIFVFRWRDFKNLVSMGLSKLVN